MPPAPPAAGFRRIVSSVAVVFSVLLFPAAALPADEAFRPPVEAAGTCPPDASMDLEDIKTFIPRYSRAETLHTDDLPQMKARNVVRVLTDYSRTNYFLHEGHFFGFEYSLLKEYEDYLNRGVPRGEMSTSLEFFPMPRNRLLDALRLGLGDVVAAGIEPPENPPKGIAASDPYLQDVGRVLVFHRRTGPVKRLADLAGRQVYVIPRAPEYRTLSLLNHRLAERGSEPIRAVEADPVLGPEDLLEMVNADIVELSLVQKHIAVIWSRLLPELKLYEPDPPGPTASLAWLVRSGNPELRESLNRFVKFHKKGTKLGNIYFRRYYESIGWLKNPLEEKDRRRLSRYLPLFRKYGDRYRIDWRLLAAVAYQESGLDPTSRSPRGAVGIMQVLPSTARDKRVGIEDPLPVENNIHAGAKYLALLRDEYFAESQIPAVSRLRFALAAYNAGPATIRRCREQARLMGYDANRWFQHCEQAALALRVEETVRYVNNVNRYLLAYRLAETLDCLKQKVRGGLTTAPGPPEDGTI